MKLKRILALVAMCIVVLCIVACSNIAIATPLHSHKFGEWEITKEATCNEVGEQIRKCSCGEEERETISLKEYSASEIYELTANAVGEIITSDSNGKELSLGTGFVFSEDGQIITNYHVIDGAYSAKITINGITYNVTHVLSYDKTIDIAVLKISANGLSPLKICKSSHAVGKNVFAVGSSKGLTSTFSQGIITYDSRDVDGITYVQHDAAISSGNSGGPLINTYGEIIGINTWTIRDSQNLNFAISVKELDNLNYTSPLTFGEFYEKECDTFTKLKNYIMSKGTFDSSDNDYTLVLGYEYSSDYSSKYTRTVVYDVNDDEIALYLVINSDYVVGIYIDEIDNAYSWTYLDDDNYTMSGTLYAETYTSNHLLGYSYNNITSSSLRSSIRSLASSMVNILLSYLDLDFSSIGVTAEDLGFLYY